MIIQSLRYFLWYHDINLFFYFFLSRFVNEWGRKTFLLELLDGLLKVFADSAL